MSHATCGDRRPVSQLHSADDVPELMRRAMRSLVRAEELAKDLVHVSDAERDALRAGFLALVRRYAVQLHDDGETQPRAFARLREELDDSLMPFSVRHHCETLMKEAEGCVADYFTSVGTNSDAPVPSPRLP
jgi:hypothetical protein